ncbi:gastrula zinc finger protein XlCGF48.2-like [Saccostrea cucullata]|uniref:gastrula zinc finger protein XlCGF48.2-like n=1 Tax=Saccostrea cuccullata TaxID=36930 RepID=UPI002ED2FB1A
MEAEEEDFPRTIILGNPEKNSKIKVQWADDSFRVGSGFGVQSNTKLVSLLDKQRSSIEEPPVKQFSLVDKQNTEDKNSIENSTKTHELATNKYYDDMLNVIPNQTSKSENLEMEHPAQNEDVKPVIQSIECRNLNENDKHLESKAEGDVCNSLQIHRTSNQSAERDDSTETYSSDKSESKLTEGKTQCWVSILQKPSSTVLPGNLSTSTSNATSNPEATLNEKGASFIMNSDTKVLEKLGKTKAWTSILKKPTNSSLVANSLTSTSNDTCNPAATVNKKDQTLPALSIDENLASLVSLTDECHNKLFPLQKKQIEACIPNTPKVDSSVKCIVSMASATEKKLAEEKKVYSVSLLNQTSSFNKSHSAFQENFKQANDSAEKQSISKHGASHKTLVSLLNGKTFPMSVPLKNVQEGYSITSEMHVKSPTNDFYSLTKRKSEQIDTSLDEAFGKECSPSEAIKRRKTDKQHASKSDDGESFDVFIDPNFDTAHENEETSYNNEVKKEFHDSDFHTFDSDTSRLDTENNSGSEATTSLFIKQETLDPEYGDEPLVSTENVNNPVSTISTMNIRIKEEASSEDGHLFNKNGCDAEDSEDRNISFVKQEVFDPEYEDMPPDLSMNAPSMSQESTDFENEDIPPVLSPKKEADDSEFEEWNEDCEDSPPVLQKEDNLSKEDTTLKIPKRITKNKLRKQVRSRDKNLINDKFMCPICKAVFEKIEDFDVHKALHSGQQILSDKQCPEKFVIKPLTIRQDGNRKFKCEYCGKAFNRPSNLKEHTRIHTGMYPHRCQLCDKGFHTRSRFLAHMARHDEIKETKEAQDIVLKYTKDDPTNEEMEIQEFSDMKLRKYVCNICNEIFDKVTLYRIHRLKHRGEIPHTCNSCGKAFPCKSDLVRHEATHSDERPYKCHICFKSFKRRNALVDHLTIHKREESNESGEKDSVDSIMKTLEPSIESIVQSLEPNSSSPGKSVTETEKEFENFKEMERPIYTDDGQKIINSKFYCKECKISFSARREYSMHRFQHNGGHPHVCEVCNKVYPYKSDYDRHVATHLGRKPYVCHLCSCEFSRKHYLQKHLLKHKNTRISLGGMSKPGNDFQIEIDNPEKSASEVSDCEDNGDVDLRTTAGKLETSYDEDGAMFLFVTDD